jgi:6-phosphogluconolactonase
MSILKYRLFECSGDFVHAASACLAVAMNTAHPVPHGVMLAGGSTPLPVYRHLAETGQDRVPDVHVMLTDERMVPADSVYSNYGHIRFLLDALGIGDKRMPRVDTSLPLPEAAAEYANALQAFLANGVLTLGLLGLGTDGHTCSIFSRQAARPAGRMAMPVTRGNGPDRVSVTADLLQHAQRLIFLAAGPEKAGIVQQLRDDPLVLPAGVAVAGHPRVELWYCKDTVSA